MTQNINNYLIYSENLTQNTPDKPQDQKHWGNLPSAAQALAIAECSHSQNQPLCLIANNTQEAIRLEQEIEFFLSNKPSKDQASSSLPVSHFPDWEILPYDAFSPHQDIVSERLRLLAALPNWQQGILIVALPTLLHRMTPRSFVDSQSLVIEVGDRMNLDQMRQRLERAGYSCVNTVYEHGEFAVRGSIIDLFPMGSNNPFRIDLFDDEIESIRTFDAENQRSQEKLNEVAVLPAKEFPLTEESIKGFIHRWHDHFEVDAKACPIYKDVSHGLSSAGLEYYLPLFFDKMQTLFDYLPQNTLVIQTQRLADASEKFWHEVNERYEEYNIDITRPLLHPAEVLMRPNEFHQTLKDFPSLTLHKETLETKPGRTNISIAEQPELIVHHKDPKPLKGLEAYLAKLQAHKYSVLITAESAGRREALLDLFKDTSIQPKPCDNWAAFLSKDLKLGICVAPLVAGIELPDQKISVISESQLFGKQVIQSRRRRKSNEFNQDSIIKNLTELREHAPVVHIDHGVGRFKGLEQLEIDNNIQEFVVLLYANDAKLYVPVTSLHLISRYSGVDAEHAPMHKLGSDQWQKEKRKAAEKAHDAAAELLDIFARRAAQTGFVYSIEKNEYRQFSTEFPFEETADQADAIQAVLADMQGQQPMDRLICGDVGFGKTEVAMRAAFIATQAGKQVSVLVPTTLLAQQHYESFRDRFAQWPVSIEVLSRFKTAKEQSQVMQKLAEGKVDIIIGTHKLLQKSVQYQNLGLIVVDEEHRFGVRHKEALKKIRANVDVLTLTATPIPRTLNMAMSGLRDISIIATPPAKRLSVKTFVRQSQGAIVKEAMLRELLRGGQVYYLHNEVKTIEKTADELKALIPEARVGVAHGQLRESELERVMSEFYHQTYNVLVCTTIVETGIDVPSANTIIMDRADKLGLAQLHQLRGRVGRSHHQAYAYLLTPTPKAMTKDALKRLEAIQEADTLGAGFILASNDLEIRGAGEFLGDEQSGHVQSIGFNLYLEMLNRAVELIKSGDSLDLDQPLNLGTEINCHAPALIPDDFLPDVNLRLTLYKRITHAQENDTLDHLRIEMIDRFGLLPTPLDTLFKTMHVKLAAQAIGVEKIDLSAQGGRIEFNQKPNIDPMSVIKLVQNQPNVFRLDGASKLRITKDLQTAAERLEWLHKLLKQLRTTTTNKINEEVA